MEPSKVPDDDCSIHRASWDSCQALEPSERPREIGGVAFAHQSRLGELAVCEIWPWISRTSSDRLGCRIILSLLAVSIPVPATVDARNGSDVTAVTSPVESNGRSHVLCRVWELRIRPGWVVAIPPSAQRSCRSVARPVPHAEVAARRGLPVTRWSGGGRAEAGPRQLQRLVGRRHGACSVLSLQ